MIFGVIAAILAALAYGTASVLQARGAAEVDDDQPRSASAHAPSLRSTITAMLTASFLVGMALDAMGFIGSLVSARLAPLFLSQTIIASNLIVTAILAVFVLNTRPLVRDWVAIGVVVVSLVVLGFSAAGEGESEVYRGGHWLALVAGLALIIVGIVAIRVLSGIAVALAAGITGGVLFGVMALAVRITDGVDPFDLGALFTDPAAYAIVIAGVGGFYLFTVALQSGSVNGAAAALVVGETVVPGVIGIVLLGDATRHGWGPVAMCAFGAAIIGAVAVALSGAAPQS